MNYLVLQDYQRAISLALAMEQPGRLFNLLTDVRNAALEDALVGTTSTVTGSAAVDEVIRTMPKSELTKLLGYLRDWNARAKTSVVAQDILHAVVKLRSAEDIMAAFQSTASFLDDAGFLSQKQIGSTALTEIVDALIPYTERHLSRVDKLVQESFVIDYLLSEMDTILGDFDETDVILDEVGPESSEEDSNGLMDVESA
jgi:U3 small nucleolar RNA-associated protein 13